MYHREQKVKSWQNARKDEIVALKDKNAVLQETLNDIETISKRATAGHSADCLCAMCLIVSLVMDANKM